MTGHALGRLMRDSVRRVIHLAAGRKRFALEFAAKNTPGKSEDFFSGLDLEAQRVYERMVEECLPRAGFIAEEGKIHFAPQDADGITITADGIDGTKALKRQQSHGIGTMVSAVKYMQVIAAYVGDVCTGEIYGYHPDSTRVSRIIESMYGIELAIDTSRPLSDQQVLLRENTEEYGKTIQNMVKSRKRDGLFKSTTIMGGSIGTWLAMLWKGEVGAAILPRGNTTPWDWCPVIGICERLGFVVCYWDNKELYPFRPVNILAEGQCGCELIIVHASRTGELHDWLTGHSPVCS